MAKEITHDSLDNIIKDYANVDKIERKEKKQKDKKGNNKLKVMLIIAIISIIGNGVLFSLYLIEKNNIKEKKVVKYEESEPECSIYDKQKLDFYDSSVVFVVEGLGNYYYTYDCMMQKVSGDYTFWAYNREAAIDEGYVEGSCN